MTHAELAKKLVGAMAEYVKSIEHVPQHLMDRLTKEIKDWPTDLTTDELIEIANNEYTAFWPRNLPNKLQVNMLLDDIAVYLQDVF